MSEVGFDDTGIVLHFLRYPLANQMPLIQYADSVTQPHDHADIVLNQQDRLTAISYFLNQSLEL